MDVILMCAIDGSNSFMTPAYFHSRTVFLYSTFKKKGGGVNKWKLQSVSVDIILRKDEKITSH